VNGHISNKGYFKYINPDNANKILLGLQYPTIKTHKKETFLKTFRSFQELFARHCALVSCVSPDIRSEITVKALCLVLKELQEDHATRNDINDSEGVYNQYLLNLKRICEDVDYGKVSLFETLRFNLSYNPQKFITVVRGKNKEGVWKSGEEYDSKKLYFEFRTICQDELNILK